MSIPPSSIYTVTTYDDMGHVASQTNPYRTTGDSTYGSTQFFYDALGRKYQEVDADETSTKQWCYNDIKTNGQTNCNALAGDQNGTWVDSADENNNDWQHVSDAEGRLLTAIEPSGTSATPMLATDYSYDALGDLTCAVQRGTGSAAFTTCSAAPANWRPRSFTYDSLGRLTSATNPENGLVKYAYDADGNVFTKTDARNVTITYTYDALNRLVYKNYSTGDPSACMQYDTPLAAASDSNPIGHLTAEWLVPAGTCPALGQYISAIPGTAINSTIVSAHDSMGRELGNFQCPYGSNCGTLYAFNYQYDEAGNLTQFNNGMPSGSSSVSSPSLNFQVAYDALSRVSQLTNVAQPWASTDNAHPQDLVSNPTYDSMGHMASAQISTLPSNQLPMIEIARQYDKRGRIVSENDTGNPTVTSGTDSSGSITISGTEASAVYNTTTYATGSVTIAGSTDEVAYYYPCGEASCPTEVYDSGTITLTVAGTNVSTSYTKGSTASGIASALVAGLQSSAVKATANGSTINLTAAASGSAGNSIAVTSSVVWNTAQYKNAQDGTSELFTSPSFSLSPSSTALSGGGGSGTDSVGTITISGSEAKTAGTAATSGSTTLTITGAEGTTRVCTTTEECEAGCKIRVPVTTCTAVPNTGSLTVTIDGFTARAYYGSGSTDASIASVLASEFTNSGTPVTPSYTSGSASLTLTAIATGTASNYAVTLANGGGFTITDPNNALSGGQNSTVVYDTGSVTATVNVGGTLYTTSAVNYGQNDTTSTVATNLASAINLAAGSYVSATSSGAVITVKSTGVGTATNYPISSSVADTNKSYFSTPSFSLSATSMSGGQNPPTIYDTGIITATITNNSVIPATTYTAAVNWGPTSTASGIASALLSAIETATGNLVTGTTSGGSISLKSTTAGATSDYSISVSAKDTQIANYPTLFSSASFTASGASMTGGSSTADTLSQVYSYVVPTSGYAPNGNLLGYQDSVMGNWSFGYDTLNRLTSGTASSGVYSGETGCWAYDIYGNRTQQSFQTSGACSFTQTEFYNNTLYNNQMVSIAQTTPVASSGGLTEVMDNSSSYTYDASGDALTDVANQYVYDAEGRICAVYNGSSYTGYVYDAAGARVAKTSLSSLACNPANPSYQAAYLLDLSGDQVTELRLSGGTATWAHTNLWAATRLTATYDALGLHFHLADPLGSRRVQLNAGGDVEESCFSLPFGDALNCIKTNLATADDATEHHFTGKERDSESGNDYFGARYYASAMGRWMSPDWAAKAEPVPYAKLDNPQSLNLYAYVLNNPLSHVDPDGHDCYTTMSVPICISTLPPPLPPPPPPPTNVPGATPAPTPKPPTPNPAPQPVPPAAVGGSLAPMANPGAVAAKAAAEGRPTPSAPPTLRPAPSEPVVPEPVPPGEIPLPPANATMGQKLAFIAAKMMDMKGDFMVCASCTQVMQQINQFEQYNNQPQP